MQSIRDISGSADTHTHSVTPSDTILRWLSGGEGNNGTEVTPIYDICNNDYMLNGWRRGVVVNALIAINEVALTLVPITTWVNHLVNRRGM